jgi:predicted aconitase
MPTRPTRRTFIKLSAAAASLTAAELAHAAPPTPQVSIIAKESGITGSEPVQWAIGKLKDALTARGILAANPPAVIGFGTPIITITQA